MKIRHVDTNSMVCATQDALVTDSRNMLEHLERGFDILEGDQKQMNLELLTLLTLEERDCVWCFGRDPVEPGKLNIKTR